MDSYQALYYPFIHFRDENWVKLSALYWDKLKRIVPAGYPTDDGETVKALGGFVEAVCPNEKTVQPDFAATFGQFFADYGDKLQANYALKRRDDWAEVAPLDKPPKAGGPSGIDPRLAYVHCEEISQTVFDAMRGWGLASTDERGSEWIGMHPRLAAVYMHALAEHIAGQSLRLLTDQTSAHTAAAQLSIERLAQTLLGDVKLVGDKPSPTEREALLVSIAFQTLVPAELKTLDVDKILKFREAFPAERQRFQEATAGLLGKRPWLASIGDPLELEQRLRDEVDAGWTHELKELREKLASVGIATVFGSANLTTTLPAAVAGGIAALGLALNPVAAAGAAVALAAIPMLQGKRQAVHEALEKSPLAYLYRMEQDLAPKDLQQRCRQGLRRFALGA